MPGSYAPSGIPTRARRRHMDKALAAGLRSCILTINDSDLRVLPPVQKSLGVSPVETLGAALLGPEVGPKSRGRIREDRQLSLRPEGIHRFAHWCWSHRLKPVARLLDGLIRILYSCVLPASVEMGRGSKLGYLGLGIVVHGRCKIGANCTISQNVTLGGRSGLYDVPVLGDNVLVGAGAVILGPVVIGDNANIGANAVVLTDIPAGKTAVGVPARVVEAAPKRTT